VRTWGSVSAVAAGSINIFWQEDIIVKGIVKWFNNAKGYGFIGQQDDRSDVFVHYSGIIGEGYLTLNEGDRVEFEVVIGPKGPQAANVRKLDQHRGDSTESGNCQ